MIRPENSSVVPRGSGTPDRIISDNGDSIGWLRFVPDYSGRGVRAGLLQTSVEGAPLGFSFVRTDLTSDGEQGTVPQLAGSLIRSAMSKPRLLLAVVEEGLTEVFDGLGIGLPLCCIPLHSLFQAGAVTERHTELIFQQLQWVNEPPASATEAALVELMGQNNPFEPLDRTARGLTVAFGDPRVRELTSVPGLETVIMLQARNLPTRKHASSNSSVAGNGDHFGSAERLDPDLAERLWRELTVRRVMDSGRSRDRQLEWSGELMPFQKQGVQALTSMDRLLLSDDMGLGKTVQAIVALRILRAKSEIGSSLVVAPASVLDQWRREMVRWAPELSAIIVRGSAPDRAWQWRAEVDVTLVSYDVLRADARNLPKHRAFRGAWHVVVLDEAQRIKNRNDTSEAAKNIPRLRSWALTGTPIENHEEELASLLEFVDHNEGEPRKRYRPGPALLQRHGELQLRRKKVDVLHDLPPKLETRRIIPLNRDQRESYDRVEQEGIIYLKSLGAEVGVGNVLELITRLKQVCNADPRSGSSSKLDDIAERLGTLTAQGHKALVFSQYKSDASGVGAAARHLRDFNPLVLTGDVPPDQRSSLIQRFMDSQIHKVMIISLRAGGLGLNLQEASYVFHLDRWWNPAVERQAEDRTHRMGQSVKVNVIKYTCEDTIEERIDRILEAKQALFDQLVDDVSLDLTTRLSLDELLGLFEAR